MPTATYRPWPSAIASVPGSLVETTGRGASASAAGDGATVSEGAGEATPESGTAGLAGAGDASAALAGLMAARARAAARQVEETVTRRRGLGARTMTDIPPEPRPIGWMPVVPWHPTERSPRSHTLSMQTR